MHAVAARGTRPPAPERPHVSSPRTAMRAHHARIGQSRLHLPTATQAAQGLPSPSNAPAPAVRRAGSLCASNTAASNEYRGHEAPATTEHLAHGIPRRPLYQTSSFLLPSWYCSPSSRAHGRQQSTRQSSRQSLLPRLGRISAASRPRLGRAVARLKQGLRVVV
eukprot:CAMPEP_0183340414 /NCGR_PEP_ID=MMETSP0164_2-20130417/6977_1 /TAXON_ID=221442 /ORGANISM="Coccolithus pelagicus ssp braarudi, Strain PLY182g" /LENGTH=163 /DNA_ID=CAMNT_0025510549 /DNA_START=234 /DNA_END=726 /DNA_ORIENTATION=+